MSNLISEDKLLTASITSSILTPLSMTFKKL